MAISLTVVLGRDSCPRRNFCSRRRGGAQAGHEEQLLPSLEPLPVAVKARIWSLCGLSGMGALDLAILNDVLAHFHEPSYLAVAKDVGKINDCPEEGINFYKYSLLETARLKDI
ncbi:TPA: hypothetical protein DGH83_01750 [Candidatus Peregrinibacteria bacterium]|nr:hypothetical protein [Candidatus Peregrinibacteria bacterium]